jgi:hypothetical protein
VPGEGIEPRATLYKRSSVGKASHIIGLLKYENSLAVVPLGIHERAKNFAGILAC